MGRFIKGDVVDVPFPFSDLSSQKRRPALVITQLNGKDVILCQITHQLRNKDNYNIILIESDFENGKLNVNSYIRPNRLFTADSNIIISKKGTIKNQKIGEVINKLIQIITS